MCYCSLLAILSITIKLIANIDMSLGVKLYISIFLVMFIGLGIFIVKDITNQRNNLLNLVQVSAVRATDIIRNSIHYSMLINRKDDIEQIFKYFEEMEGIEVIRIYDKNGKINFTTRPEEQFSQVGISSTVCQVCHFSHTPLKQLEIRERTRFTTATDGCRIMSMIVPIRNEPACSGVNCHVSVDEKEILGVLDVQMSLHAVDEALAENQNYTIVASAILVISVLLVTGILIWTLIRKPIFKLSEATKVIASGNLNYKIPMNRHDEIGQLAHSFNIMVRELNKAQNEVTKWSNTLQEKVEQKTVELEEIQAHLIQVEKMASLGKLSATVAHELNNPLAGILTYVRLTQRRLDKRDITPDLLQSVQEDLTIVSNEIIRCGNIVRNLLLFSKRKIGEYTYHNIETILDNCLQLIQHHLELNSIVLKRIPSPVPLEVKCDSEQIQQAALAILMNGIETMPNGGTLTVGSDLVEDNCQITIQDTGEGIPEDQLPYIFEPFYTSKTEGKGVGLGLSVAFGIVDRHKGTIDVKTEIDKGTTFIINIPKNLNGD